MADPSGNDPTSNPFAFWLAQRQFEEARRRADRINRFNDNPSTGASAYQLQQLSPPIAGIASPPIFGPAPSSVGAEGLLNTGGTWGPAALLRTAALAGAVGLPEDALVEAPLAGAALLASLLELTSSGK